MSITYEKKLHFLEILFLIKALMFSPEVGFCDNGYTSTPGGFLWYQEKSAQQKDHSENKSFENPSGFLWYRQKAKPELQLEKKPPEPHKQDSKPETKPKTAVELVEEQKALFEEVKAQAILNPSLENTRTLLRIQEAILKQATEFSKSFYLAELLHSSSKPAAMTPRAAQIERRVDEENLTENLKALSKNYGLIYIYKEGCRYCEAFAPVVIDFARKHNFELEGLTSSNAKIDGINCVQNEEAVRALNSEGAYPILYLVNPTNNEVIPLARGYVSIDELLQNCGYILNFLGKR